MVDSPGGRIIRADVRAERSPSEARTILAGRASFTEERDIIGAALTVIETYCEEKNFTDALAEAERALETGTAESSAKPACRLPRETAER